MSENLNKNTTQSEKQSFSTKKDENFENEQVSQMNKQTNQTTQTENKREVENLDNKQTNQTESQPNKTEEKKVQAEESLTQNTQKLNIKKISFWLGILALLIVGVQVILNYFGIDFEVKIVIEICSYLLALLLSVGVLKGSLKGKNFVETKENIEKALNTNIENTINKTTKNKTDKTK